MELQLETAKMSLRKVESNLTKKEQALGVKQRQEFRHLLNSPFLNKKMNARALKMRIRERLRSRKFELDRLERSYRKQRSGECLLFSLSLFADDIHTRTTNQ